MVYPEGTITRDPGLWPMTGKTGAARIALETGAPVIPVAQWGAQEVIAPYSKEFRILPRKTMHVTAGPPVDLDDLRGRALDATTLREATERIMAAITALLEEIRGETAPGRAVRPAGAPRRGGSEHRRSTRRDAGLMRIAVMGSGSWGTAFAMVLADAGNEVVIWGRDAELAEAITMQHENPRYQPGIPLPPAIAATTDAASRAGRRRGRGAGGAGAVAAREPRRLAAHLRDDAVLVSLMKGIELGTTLRMSEVIAEVAGIPAGAGRRRLRARTWPARSRCASRRRPRSRARTRPCAERLPDACTTGVLPALLDHRRRRHRDRRLGQERHRAGQRHGRGHGLRRERAGLAHHPRAGGDDPAGDRARRLPADVPRAWPASATSSPPARRRCRATGPSASTSARA